MVASDFAGTRAEAEGVAALNGDAAPMSLRQTGAAKGRKV